MAFFSDIFQKDKDETYSQNDLEVRTAIMIVFVCDISIMFSYNFFLQILHYICDDFSVPVLHT